MKKANLQQLMVTGSDTNVGKTYVTSLIAQELLQHKRNVGVYKPVCSGGIQDDEEGTEFFWPDVELLSHAIEGRVPNETICPQCFVEPLAPPVAARKENQSVNEELMLEGWEKWHSLCEVLLIEGVGGLCCPLSDQQLVADFIEKIKAPVLIVAASKLGCINHTLLTLEVAEKRKLDVVGVLLNQPVCSFDGASNKTDVEFTLSNAEEISCYSSVPLLGITWQGGSITNIQGESSPIDWEEIIGLKS